MKRCIFLVIFSMNLFAAQAGASFSTQEILVSENPFIEIDAGGVVAVKAGETDKVVVSSMLKKRVGGDVVKKTHIRIKATEKGARIETDHFSTKKYIAETNISLPAGARLTIKIKSGALKIEDMKGNLYIHQKGGEVSILRHKGNISVKMSDGKLDVSEYLGEGRNIFVQASKGEIAASIGPVAVGPGGIKMKKGNIRFEIDPATEIAVSADIEKKGVIKTSDAITRPDPKSAFFTANGGRSMWRLECVEGKIELVTPTP